MLLSITDYSRTAMTTREEAYNLACDLAKAIGQDLKPKRKKVSREKHSIILTRRGHKGKQYISELAAMVVAIECLSDATKDMTKESLDDFLQVHSATLSIVQWDCVTHLAPSNEWVLVSISYLKRFINEKTKGDKGVRAASLEALFKVFNPTGDIDAPLDKHASIQFWYIALDCINQNLSASQAFLSLTSRDTPRAKKTPDVLVTLALATLKVPSETLKLGRGEALQIIRRARNQILVKDSVDHAPEWDKKAATARQQKVNAAFFTLEHLLFPEKENHKKEVA